MAQFTEVFVKHRKSQKFLVDTLLRHLESDKPEHAYVTDVVT